jgi:small redox-active disulfide protein 2
MKKIEILGSGCAKCKKLYQQTEEAVKSLGIEAQLEKVEDIAKIMDYGVMMTPAIVVDGEVKATGRIPGADELKKMIG